jgi:acyl carrier protein
MNEFFERELKSFIATTLRLDSSGFGDWREDTPLFAEGLGLDSVDALELAVAVHHRYGVRIPAEEDDARSIMFSVRTLAEFLSAASRGTARES